MENEQSLGNLVPKEIGNLTQQTADLVDNIIKEENVDKFNNLTTLFSMNQKKKNIARIAKLSALLDVIDNETLMRFVESPESFDNDQLVKYMDATQKAITNIENTLDKTPAIQINTQNNEIHIDNSGSGLNRDSRKNVYDAVMSILNDLKTDGAIDVDYEDLMEEQE